MITSSTRAAAGVYPDRSGPVVVDRLSGWGFHVGGPIVVADGDEFGLALREVLASEPDLVVTTGGTGLTPTDVDARADHALLDRHRAWCR